MAKLMGTVLCCLLAAGAGAADEDGAYLAVYQTGSATVRLHRADDWASFETLVVEQLADGYHLMEVEQTGAASPGYVGRFEARDGESAVLRHASLRDLQRSAFGFVQNGLRLWNIEALRTEEDRFLGLLLPLDGPPSTSINNVPGWDIFVETSGRARGGRGRMQLVDFECFAQNGEQRFVGLYRSGAETISFKSFATWEQLSQGAETERAADRLLFDFEICAEGGTRTFKAAFRPGSETLELRRAATWDDFVAKFENAAERGLTLVDFEILDENQ